MEFHKNKRGRNGLNPSCKECKSKSSKKWRDCNNDKVKKRRAKTSLYHKKYMEEYRIKNKEKLSLYMKEYRLRNKEKISKHEKSRTSQLRDEYIKHRVLKNKDAPDWLVYLKRQQILIQREVIAKCKIQAN